MDEVRVMFPKFHDISYLLSKQPLEGTAYDSDFKEVQIEGLVTCILYPRSLVSGEGANKLSRVESLNVRSWLLLFEDLPDLVADVVVQQLRPHHRHEHRPHHDRHAHL